MFFDESDTAWDAAPDYDKDMGSGAITRKVGAATHLSIPAPLWPACRAAAQLGQLDFDTWVATSTLPAAARAWYASLDVAVKAAIRESALGLA